MASKAMNYFRKHQKVILAIVTIGTMLIFIVGDAVQSMGRGGGGGRGGILNWFSKKFGGDSEETLLKVAGQPYNNEEIVHLQQRRQFALDVMDSISRIGQYRFMEGIGLKEDEIKDENKRQQKLMELMSKDSTIRDAMNARDNSLLAQIKPSLLVYSNINPPEPLESISEFLLMKSKASDMGVSITPATLKDDAIRLGLNKVSLDEITQMVRNEARRRGQLDMANIDTVFNVLADEVRVSIAKQIANEDTSRFLLESAYRRAGRPYPGGNSIPQMTPADLWNNYVNVKTSLSTGILPLKVEDYLSRVPAPTEAEKLEYFEKYKKEYPALDKDTPGFKIPPMYRIGFVVADMKDGQAANKYYRSQVDAWDRIAPLNALAELANAYESKKEFTYKSVQPFVEFTLGQLPGKPWLRVYRWHGQQGHGNLVGALAHFGMAASQVATFSPGNAFAMNLYGEMVPPYESDLVHAMQKIAGATSLAGFLQPPPTIRSGTKNIYTPFNVVAPALIEQRYEAKSKEYLVGDLTELTTALNDYGKKYSEWRSKVLRKLTTATTPPYFKEETKQTLADYLTAFTKTRGLTYYETKDLRAKDDLLNEPGERLLNTFIKPLYYDSTDRATPRQLEDFVRYVLVKDEIKGEKPKLFEATNSSMYDTNRKNKEYALTWIAEASDPRTPEFKEAEAAVAKAWKMEKARPIVEEEAQKLIKDVNASADNYRKLIDMKGYAPGQTIARYSEPALSSTSPITMYTPCPIPKSVDNQPDDFINQAMEKLKKKGDMMVVPDKSKSTYYLVYLSNRSEPKTSNPLDIESFHNEVIRPSMTKQMNIDGAPFRNYATQVQTISDVSGWLEYLKNLTGINQEKAKQYLEAISRGSRQQ